MKNETVRVFTKKTDETREHVAEFDIVLPDYYPEVNQILKCSVIPVTESVSFTGDKLGISGNARATVVFSGEDGTVRVFEALQKYTKIIRCESLADGDRCFVSQDVTQLNYKATGPRRLDIRASVAVGASVFRVDETEFVSDFDDISVEQRCECFDCFEIKSAESFSFEISDTVKLPDGVNSESEQLSASGEVFIRETKVIKNKIMLKGSCAAEFIVSCADGAVRKFNAEVPFTEVKELYGADEGELCSVTASLKNAHISLKAMNNGNDAAFSAEIEAVAFTSSKTAKTAVSDAFSLKGVSETHRIGVDVISDIVTVDTTADASLEADTYDSAPAEVLAAFADGIRYGCSSSDGEGKLNGSCVLNAVLKNSAGNIIIVNRTAVFECELPYADDYFVSVSPSRVAAELLSGGKVGFSATFAGKGFGLCMKKREFIADCRVSDDAAISHGGGLAVYYAQAGEKLWNIAKENRCRVSILKEINGIDTEETAENRVVIFPVGI